MSILSYNQINELFNQVAIAHYQIKRFGSGELSEADINKFISDNQEYPVLWMTPVSVTTNSNVLLYSLNLLVFDLVNKDKDNEQEVLSDCLQIALDVVRILRYGNAEFNIVTEPNISPFAGRYSDWVAGWSLEIELEVDIQSNNCDIPYEGLDLTQVLQSFVAEGEPGFQCIDLEGCELIINLQEDVATALGNDITGGTYNSGTTNLTLTKLDGSQIIITGITSGGGSGDFNCDELADCAVITGLTGDVSTLITNVNTISGDVTTIQGDITTLESQILTAVSGGSYSAGTLTLNTIGNTTISVNGFQDSDIFTTGGTYTSGDIIFNRNDGNNYTVTGLPTGQNGGGGIVYYLNLSNAQTPYREFSPIPTTAIEQSSGVSISNGVTATIASFLTPTGYPNTNLFPGGVWTFHLHSYKQNNNASFNIFVEVYKRTSGGTETLLFTTDPTPVTTNSPNVSMQITESYFSGCPLVVSDLIVAKVGATNTGNQTHTITLITEGLQHYSYATTTFSILGLTCDTLSGCSVIQTIQTDVSNKLDKSGGTITGSLIIQSGLTANTLNISTTPTLNASPTQLLSRNSSSGNVEYTDASQYLNNTSTNQIYGSGFDGDIVMDGTNTYTAFTTKVSNVYTLTRSIYANNLTLSSTGILDPNGFGIFVKGTLTIGGTSVIRSNGNNGGNGVGGTRGTGGTGRNAAATNYIIMNTGGAGGLGGNSSGAGGSITVGVNYVGGIGGSGGFGYPVGNSGAGMPFARPVVTVTAGILQQPYSSNYLSHSLYYGTVQMFAAHSGAGGQGGINAGGAIQGGGGGGGSSPRGVLIIANTIVMSAGTAGIQSIGGNGGAGGDASGINGTGGGGGGAGGGGFIYIITNSLTYTPANLITAVGGTGGVGGLCVGTVNTQNVAGLRSQSGSNGVNGYVVIINPVSGTNVTTTGSY